MVNPEHILQKYFRTFKYYEEQQKHITSSNGITNFAFTSIFSKSPS